MKQQDIDELLHDFYKTDYFPATVLKLGQIIKEFEKKVLDTKLPDEGLEVKVAKLQGAKELSFHFNQYKHILSNQFDRKEK